MTILTDEQIARVLDPESKQRGWWIEKPFTKKTHEYLYTGPAFSKSRMACFEWLTPVLLDAGWTITQTPRWIRCAAPVTAEQMVARRGLTLIKKRAFEAAHIAAFSWLHTHDPARLAQAVGRARG